MEKSILSSIIPIINKNAGCDYHRIYVPYSHLGVDFSKLNGIKFDDIAKDTKILTFNRTPKQSLIPYLRYRQMYGYKIIVDLDDYWVLYPKHELSAVWEKQKMAEQIKFCLIHADAVTVTTSLLADKVKDYNKNVHVIPNAFPFGKDQFNEQKTESNKLRFMYAGGSSHKFDLKQLTVPFQKVNNNPQFSNCVFSLAGVPVNQSPEWTRIVNSFSLNGKLKNFNIVHAKTLHDYMDVYKESDVCLVPLEGNQFNARKSNLKIIEAGCKYNPAICSNVSPYSDEPNKSIVMYANNAREWYDHMKYCMENPDFVKQSGLRLGEYVREHYNLEKANEYRKQLIEHLIK